MSAFSDLSIYVIRLADPRYDVELIIFISCTYLEHNRSHAKNIIGPFGESISLSITPFGT